MKLANRVVVVTGAGSGMGRELALELLRRGASVAAVDVNEATLRETAALAGEPERLATYVVNIADRAAVEALAEAIVGRFGAVDGVVNCAGIIQPFVRLNELDYAAIERVMDVNWRGTLYMTRTFLPLLLERPAGHIVNVSSMGGFLPVPGQTAYGASKAAVKLFTEGLHSELAGTRVRVTVVFPARSRRTSPPTPASRRRPCPAARCHRSIPPTGPRGTSSTAWSGTATGSSWAAMRS